MPDLREQLDMAMNPQAVAVVGARRADDYLWLRNVKGFHGKVYSVQVAPDDIAGIEEMGIPNFKSLTEIPDPVDYVIVAVPRRVVPAVLRDAIAKGVKTVHMFTSGFGESGSEEGLALQQQIAQMAQEAGVLIIGPNCMGMFNPEAGMRVVPWQELRAVGSVAVIAQSGGHAASLTQAIQASGIGIYRGVSIGNALMVDSPDLLHYFGQDPRVELVCMYVEGPRDGRRLFQVLRETTRRKPVVLWRGGQTQDGQRAAASHTGSLAGSAQVWDALVRQTGAIRADSLEEAVDVTKALACLIPTTGDGVGVIGGSGGQSVSMADDFAGAGLRVPVLSSQTLQAMSEFFQLIGASYYNPIDIGGINRSNIKAIIELLMKDSNVDTVAVLVGMLGPQRRREALVEEMELYAKTRDTVGKPVLAMFWAPIPYHDGATLEELDRTLQGLGIPVFPSPARAARALKKAVDYYRFRQSAAEQGQ